MFLEQKIYGKSLRADSDSAARYRPVAIALLRGACARPHSHPVDDTVKRELPPNQETACFPASGTLSS
jgi:hypothetical protein